VFAKYNTDKSLAISLGSEEEARQHLLKINRTRFGSLIPNIKELEFAVASLLMVIFNKPCNVCQKIDVKVSRRTK